MLNDPVTFVFGATLAIVALALLVYAAVNVIHDFKGKLR